MNYMEKSPARSWSYLFSKQVKAINYPSLFTDLALKLNEKVIDLK